MFLLLLFQWSANQFNLIEGKWYMSLDGHYLLSFSFFFIFFGLKHKICHNYSQTDNNKIINVLISSSLSICFFPAHDIPIIPWYNFIDFQKETCVLKYFAFNLLAMVIPLLIRCLYDLLHLIFRLSCHDWLLFWRLEGTVRKMFLNIMEKTWKKIKM